MKKTTFRSRLRLLILLVLVLLALLGFAVGKYKTTTENREGTLKVDARLATAIVVEEYGVERQPNGTYSQLDTIAKEDVKYILMPGVDIPMKAHVRIQGKTKIPAYLYLKVETANDAIDFDLCSHWNKTDEANVYVYSTKDAEGNVTPIEITADPGNIQILANNTVLVTQYLLAKNTPESPLSFTATLKEVVEG